MHLLLITGFLLVVSANAADRPALRGESAIICPQTAQEWETNHATYAAYLTNSILLSGNSVDVTLRDTTNKVTFRRPFTTSSPALYGSTVCVTITKE
jgi:hypothetical protein